MNPLQAKCRRYLREWRELRRREAGIQARRKPRRDIPKTEILAPDHEDRIARHMARAEERG